MDPSLEKSHPAAGVIAVDHSPVRELRAEARLPAKSRQVAAVPELVNLPEKDRTAADPEEAPSQGKSHPVVAVLAADPSRQEGVPKENLQ